jgi:hypothetical protein
MFISNSSAALAHPYFYLLRTNSKWSLCLLSGLPPSIYSALLLECKLVKIKQNVAMLDRKQWDVFQTSFGLRGDTYGCGGCMELTDARIKHAAIFEEGEVDNSVSSWLSVLRVGRVKSGKPPPSNTAINNGEEPPRMTRAMREVKDCLREATMSLLDGDEAKKNDVLAVEQWLLMKTTAFDASGSKRKCEDDNNNNSKGPKTDEGQCNEKSKPTTLPAVATPIRSPTGPSMQTLSRHELQSGGNLV